MAQNYYLQYTGEEIDARLKSIDDKAPLSQNVSITINTSDWTSNTTQSGYAYKATKTVSGVTANNNIIIGLSASATAAQVENASICGIVCKEQSANQIALYSKTLPATALPIDIIILG